MTFLIIGGTGFNVMNYLIPEAPHISPVNILIGLNTLFSGFEKPIINVSKINNIEYSSLIFELVNRKLVAGQEDLILEIAKENNKKKIEKYYLYMRYQKFFLKEI